MEPKLVLFHFPGSSSGVSLCALEAARIAHSVRLVNLAVGEQNSESYRAISPLGKVPVLTVNDVPLAESCAIVLYIANLSPSGGIFPENATQLMVAEALSGLSFCSSTLHPQLRGALNPQMLTVGQHEPVIAQSKVMASKSLAYAEQRIASQDWWLGERSIVDVHLDWAFAGAQRAGFDKGEFPALASLRERLSEWAPYTRMQQRDEEFRATMSRG